MKKGYIFLFLLPLLIGCIQTEVSFKFRPDGKYDTDVSFTADKIMAGEQVDLYAWQIRYIFPSLAKKYEHTVSTFEKEYSQYVRHSFSAEGLPISDFAQMPDVSFKKNNDGTYSFQSTIPKLVEEVQQETANEVVLVVNIEMPKAIDVANTTDSKGKNARWVLTKELLSKGAVLKAVTNK